jgi:hypothetical protein
VRRLRVLLVEELLWGSRVSTPVFPRRREPHRQRTHTVGYHLRGAAQPRQESGRPHRGGGTNTAQAVRAHYARHDRVVIVTDEQAHYDHRGGVDSAVPAKVPMYTWNLAGYQRGHTPSGTGNRHTFGGLTDQAFRMIPLLEAGTNATWPWP